MAKGLTCPLCNTYVSCPSCEGFICPGCGSDLPVGEPQAAFCPIGEPQRYSPADNDNDDEEVWDD